MKERINVKIEYDYSKLIGRIIEKFGSQKKFAPAVRLSERSLSLKLNGLVPFKQPEIDKSAELLSIPEKEIGLYFFTRKVQNF